MGIRLSTLKDTEASNTLDQFIKHESRDNDDVIFNDDSMSSVIQNEDSSMSVKSESERTCPLCSRTFDHNSTDIAINKHIDECLSVPKGWAKNASTAATRAVPVHTKSNKLHTIDKYSTKPNVSTEQNVTHSTPIVQQTNVQSVNAVSPYSIDCVDVDEFFSV